MDDNDDWMDDDIEELLEEKMDSQADELNAE